MILEDYDENEHSKEGYAYFGLAVYYVQVLEHQLVNMIVLLRKTQGKILKENDLDVLYARKFSNTMGQLINEIKQLFDLHSDEMDELKEILKVRNFIVHDYFKERIALTVTRTGRNEIINEFQVFVDRIKRLDKKLEKYSNDLHVILGISQADIDIEISRLKKEERMRISESKFHKGEYFI
ncbi:MAG: hypothetical protein WD424_09215 [Paenibacillaceae bacterium]